jgi:hypothetical protein
MLWVLCSGAERCLCPGVWLRTRVSYGSVAKMGSDLRQASAWCGPQISGDVLWRPSDLRSKGDMVKVTCSCSAAVGSDARP